MTFSREILNVLIQKLFVTKEIHDIVNVIHDNFLANITYPFEEFWGRLSWRSYCSICYSKYWEYRYNDKITLALVELFKR